MIRDLR